jgi:hypothetical protein
VLSIIGWASVIASVFYGAGRHTYHILQDIGKEGLIIGLKWNYVTQLTYTYSLSFVKISIGFFLVRFIPSGKYKNTVYGVCVVVIIYTLACSGALFGACKPFAANFDRTIPGASCYTPEVMRAVTWIASCKYSLCLCFSLVRARVRTF